MRRYSDELYHFGIKGMHWGVRRFQRKDGSLTAKGRKHVKTNPSYDSDKEARKAKIKKYAKRAAIGVGVTAALAGAGYLAYKNRGKANADPILETLKKQDSELNSILKTQKENRKKIDSAIASAEERLHGQSTYGDSRLDAIAKRQQFRVINGGSKRQRLERRRGKATSPDIIWKKNMAKINGNPTIHTKPIQKSKFTDRGRSELTKVGINTVQRINVPRTKVDRIQPDRIQPDRVNIDYATLKAKYDKLSNAVSAQQAFLNSIPKSERKKKKSKYLRSKRDIDRYFQS